MDPWYELLNGNQPEEEERRQQSPYLFLARFLGQMGVLDSFNSSKLPPPASKEAVELLKKVNVDVDTEKECPICIREFSAGDVEVTMPCRHQFHDQCILVWLKKTNSCPVCRFELKTDDVAYEELQEQKRRQKDHERNVETLHDMMYTVCTTIVVGTFISVVKYRVAMEGFQGKIEENILHGPADPGIIDEDLVKAFYQALLETGDAVSLTNAVTGETKTGYQIIKEAENLAINLRDIVGIRIGDVVAVCTENTIHVDVVLIAVWMLGAVYGAVNPIYKPNEFLHILGVMKPKIIFCGEAAFVTVQKISSKVPSIQTLITFGDSGDVTFNQLLMDVDFDMKWAIPVSLDSVGALFCSSGTTGLPKCVELSYLSIQRSMTSMLYIHDCYKSRARVAAGFLPQYHGYGIIICMDAIFRRNNLIVFPRFEINHFLESCEKYKIQTLFVVPPILVLLAKHPQVLKTDLSAVIEIRSGAAPAKPSLIKEVMNRTSRKVLFYQGYGLTETAVLSVMVPTVKKMPPASVGIVLTGMKCKVSDLSTGAALGPHEQGELCFKGDNLMIGYKDNPEATAATFDSDGWFHTGDVGSYDENGWVFVQERIKELIKYNAMQVSPSELEALLLTHPAVNEAAVWGKPDEAAGQLPMAFVVPELGVQITSEEIEKFVAENVSPHKKIRGGVVFVKEIPKTASGKLLRRFLHTLVPSSLTLSPP